MVTRWFVDYRIDPAEGPHTGVTSGELITWPPQAGTGVGAVGMTGFRTRWPS
jgi:hypothetical protein